MRRGLTAVAAALALGGPAGAEQYREGIGQVETPSGLARVEGDWRYPSVERLVIGDATVVEPEPEGTRQAVWIEAQAGTLLLVGLGSIGNGCFTEYVWVHTAPEDGLRVTEPFGTCGGDLEVTSNAETVTVSMTSPDPGEGRLDYVYDGRVVRERGADPAASG